MKFRSSNPSHLSTRLAIGSAMGATSPRPFHWRILAATALVILTLGHTAQPQAQAPAFPALTQSIALRGCTQEDAPALELYFTPAPWSGIGDPQPPFLRFEISAIPAEDLSGTTLQLIPLHRDSTKPGRIARAEFSTAVGKSAWLPGTLTLDHAAAGSPISGHYTVTTPAGQHLASTFQMAYPTKPSVCG